MDKQTVLAHMTVFTHWLNDGKVLVRYTNPDFFAELGWMPFSNASNFWSSNCMYIIDDQYVEYRKHLHAGGTIECYLIHEQMDNPIDDVYTWQHLSIATGNPSFTFSSDLQYRIKD